MLGLTLMRRLSVVIAVALTGCATFALQPNPKSVAVESTFPTQPKLAELPAQFKIAQFNVHKEPGDKITASG